MNVLNPTIRNKTKDVTIRHKSIFARNIYACIIGNAFEWYDFILFGAFASTITKLFFPEDNFQVGLLKTYGVFAAGFIMRPLGSLILGSVGDKYGRKPALIASILLMAIPTIAIGFLPTYEHLGFYAPLFLIVLRLIQGFALGGEYSGSMVFLFEHAPEHKKAFMTSWVDCGCLFGVLCGTLAAWVASSSLAEENYLLWGWRLPFLASTGFAVLAFYFRKNLQETTPFQEQEAHPKILNQPLILKIISAVFIYAFGNVGFYLFLIFLPNYLIGKSVLTPSHSFLLTSVMSGLIALSIPFAGYLSDKFGRKKLLFLSIIITSLMSIPLFITASSWSLSSFIFIQIIFSICLSLFYGGEAAFFSETFPTRYRFTAVSLSLSLSNILFGGGAPFAAEWISQELENIRIISLGIIILGVVAMISLISLPSPVTFSRYGRSRLAVNASSA